MEQCTSNDEMQSGDDNVSRLLRACRPTADLPPGFQSNVWRRIEHREPKSVGAFEWLAGWLLTPRVATAGLAAVIVLASGAGAMRGIRAGEREARDRYVASVDPSYFQP